jgi:hypothetical protein
METGFLALSWIAQGAGYEITSADVWLAYSSMMKAAEAINRGAEARDRVRQLALAGPAGRFVNQVLGRELVPEA